MRRLMILAITAFASLLGTASTSSSHDLKGMVMEQQDPTYQAVSGALAATPYAEAETRSVLSNLVLWPAGTKLTICFVSGKPPLREKIAKAMQRQWEIGKLSNGQLTYDSKSFSDLPDCGNAPTADIRVAFKPGNGHWSYVGTISRKYLPSMNFDGFEEAAPTGAEFDRIVGHELGHALGLEHEHQSPAAKCGWNYPYILESYSWKSENEMRENLDALQDYIVKGKHAYSYLPVPDRKSMMHYWFEPDAFTDKTEDPCYIRRKNNLPSDLDEDAISIAYGPKLNANQELTRGLASKLMQKFSNDEFAIIRELLNAKIELLKQKID